MNYLYFIIGGLIVLCCIYLFSCSYLSLKPKIIDFYKKINEIFAHMHTIIFNINIVLNAEGNSIYTGQWPDYGDLVESTVKEVERQSAHLLTQNPVLATLFQQGALLTIPIDQKTIIGVQVLNNHDPKYDYGNITTHKQYIHCSFKARLIKIKK